ncbi:hypothetical protein L1889_11725 [Paenalcaligenes niemegkensis]|uniref:ParA family protein n=1 Tax=Paenalcaligenes niemegkensis TaxID=2895469 RepID=UPI001EE802F7|nr:hypothetical protein [Paenalcaligenes niemegkensis]MCQ9617275.1 hypothetical protein [Paenalcaligenes niemegkensis]
MVQSVKTLHAGTIFTMNAAHKRRFLKAQVPFASDVERMGVHRAPVMATTPNSAASKAYQALSEEISARLV